MRYMALLFLITFVIGMAEIASALGMEIVFIPSDIIGGMAMLVISAIFLRGIFSEESEAYYYVGSAILAVFGVLYILVMLAEGASFIMAGEEVIIDIRPEMFTLPLAFPGIFAMKKAMKKEL